jgi:hypothetical protein
MRANLVVGYATSVEARPGVFVDEIKTYTYTGDVLRQSVSTDSGTNVNPTLKVTNRFSLVGDWSNYDNFAMMRYIEWMGAKWTITNVEYVRPRLIVSVGGLYNGK